MRRVGRLILVLAVAIAFAAPALALPPNDKPKADNGPGGPANDKPKPDNGPGGPGNGRNGNGRGPGPGQVLPGFLQDRLKLTDEQKKQVEDLQKDVDAKLDKILTDDQKKELKEMRNRGPRGPRNPGGPRGPGGPPPDDNPGKDRPARPPQ